MSALTGISTAEAMRAIAYQINQIYLIVSFAMIRMSATEVSRQFSSVVSRVNGGEEIEVIRNGVPVMQLRAPAPPRMLSAARWRELLEASPPVDDEFKRDVEEARKRLGPPRGAWPS